jgi:hypothetical protein
MTPRRPRLPVSAFIVLHSALFALALAGCGYSQSSTRPTASVAASGAPARQGGKAYKWSSLYRDDVRTVAVPIFQNRSFRRGVEVNLTKAIVNQLEATTPYKVAPREHADSILEGEILDVHLRTMTTGVGSLPQEQLYIVRLNFTWKDLRTGKILTERRRFEQSSTYFPTLGEGEFVASQQNVEKLATAIVQELQADW